MHLSLLDWLVILAFMVATLGLAHWAQKGHANLAGYFLADRGLSWMTVGLCLFATLFSTVSFVAIPGEGYRHGVLFSLNSIGYALFTPLAIWLFLRFFYNTSSFTAYEYLERRFDRRVRTLGAIIFVIARLLYLAVVFYSAGKIFETLLGWAPWITIAAVGVFTVYYSFYGGMKAIALTDVLQSIVIFVAIVAIIVKLCFLIGFDFSGLARAVQASGRGFHALTTPEFYRFDLHVRYSFWTALTLAVLGPLANYGTDQLFIQRMLSTKSYAQAKKAIWFKTLVALPVSLGLYLIGVMMFYYYQSASSTAPAVEADQLLGYFINQHLPPPFPGLVAAALLAALMSTVSGTAATLATVTTIDLLAHIPRLKDWSGLQSVQTGRWLTGLFGGLSMLIAILLFFASRGVESTVLEMSQIWAGLWLILLVVILGGILTTWVTRRAALIALLVGVGCNLVAPYLLYYRVPASERISFVWVSIPGLLVTAILLIMVSLFDRQKAQNLDGLTFRTLKKPSTTAP